MKRTLLALLSIFALLTSATADPSKFGVANYADIQAAYYKTQIEEQALAKLRQGEEAKLKGPAEEGKKLMEAQKNAQALLNDNLLSAARRQQTLSELGERAAKIGELKLQLQKQELESRNLISVQAKQVQASILSDISTAVAEVAKAKKLHFVYNTAFGIEGVPALGYFAPDQVTDITKDVIAKLNEKAPES